MGLDTTHDCWSGGYGSFHRYRLIIAKTVGIELDKMEGFTNPPEAGLSWNDLRKDKICVLLNHSDCDGHINWRDTLPLAQRLEGILPLIKDEWAIHKTILWINGLKEAHQAKDRVEFH